MKKDGLKLYCFSPPVMLATFVIEILLFIYTMWRYKLSTVGRLIGAALICLAIFQLAEYNVCTYATGAISWSKLGFAAITLLPAIGIHLIISTAKQDRWKPLTWLGYLASAGFVSFFVLSSDAFSGHVCAGNYVIFHLTANLGGAFFVYYYSLLIIGICLSLYFCLKASQKIREALLLQVFGYLTLLLPTAITNTVKPQTIEGLPSIMCGFAVLYALVLAFGIAPRVLQTKNN